MPEKNKTGAAVKSCTFDLKFGYEGTSPEGESKVTHSNVVFGRRSTGADFIRAMENAADSDTQFSIEMMASAITK